MWHKKILKNKFISKIAFRLYAEQKLRKAASLLNEKDYFGSMAICYKLLGIFKHRRDKISIGDKIVEKIERVYETIHKRHVLHSGQLPDINENNPHCQRRDSERSKKLRDMFFSTFAVTAIYYI